MRYETLVTRCQRLADELVDVIEELRENDADEIEDGGLPYLSEDEYATIEETVDILMDCAKDYSCYGGL